jgi:hypothetical protein
MKKIFWIGAVALIFFFFYGLNYMLFPPTMIWQKFDRTPVDDLGFAGKNIPLEKADTVYSYRVVLCDICDFSPSEYLEKYGDDVAINNLIFTQDKDRVVKFMEEKGVKLKIKYSHYHPKNLARQ